MIKDTGSEISKKILDHIFEEFVTDTNVSNDSQKGIGLGFLDCHLNKKVVSHKLRRQLTIIIEHTKYWW